MIEFSEKVQKRIDGYREKLEALKLEELRVNAQMQGYLQAWTDEVLDDDDAIYTVLKNGIEPINS